MARPQKFGAFSGVFTPSILTILGVIMYLRLPKIVGEAGLFITLGIIALAHVISFATGLSVASIATDKKVEAGGTYYMISRSLGLPIGGTLGLALFVGLSFSVSLYLIGFSESFLSVTGFEVNKDTIRIAGSAMLLLVTIITFISTSLAIKTQFIIMAAIILSLVSIFFGRHEHIPEMPLLNMNPETRETFISLFGIFFPAVTGFEAGVSMSGDLKDPKKSIPKGSISAIAVGFVVYVGLAFFFSYTVNRDTLVADPQVLLAIAWFSPLVVAGIWGATVSSALGSILGAPRILQATAVDRVSPRFFAKGYGPSNEPRNALLLTFIIAGAGIMVGELDVIARIVSIFFITTYGFLNLSCAFESWASADFRPDFKIPIWISLIGAIACFVVMIELDIVAMISATLLLGLLYLYLKRKELRLAGGDAWSGVWASIVKTGLERLNQTEIHNRNWRPNIIMFHGEMRHHLVELGKAIAGRLGMLSGFQLIESNVPLLAKSQSDISSKNIEENYFEHQHYCRDFFSGIDEISRVYGFSGVEPNTILMGWSRNEAHKERFLSLIKSLNKNNFNAIYLGYNRERGFGNYKTIDIWWEGWGRNLAFSFSLNKHMFYNSKWKEASVRLLAIADNKSAAEKMHRFLEKATMSQRLRFRIMVINKGIEKLSRQEIIIRESARTDLTILSLKEKESQTIEQADQQLNRLLPDLGTCMVIDASKDFEIYQPDLEPVEKITVTETEPVITHLPELTPPKYSAIAKAIWPMDAQGLKFLEDFHQKAFAPFFTENVQLYKDFASLIKLTFSGIHRSLDYKEDYRKCRDILRTKNEFYFQIQKLFEGLKNDRINSQREALNEGIEWYQRQIREEVAKVPATLTIYYDRSDFKFNREESLLVRVYKLRKRIFQLFGRNSISENVPFRKAALYYLVNNRQLFLNKLLNDLNQEYLLLLNDFRRKLNKMEPLFEHYSSNVKDKSMELAQPEVYEQEILADIDEMVQTQKSLNQQLKNRMMVDFRTNLQLFLADLNNGAVKLTIAKKRRKDQYYHHLKDENASFPDRWHETSQLIINRYYFDALVTYIRGRLSEEITELTEDLSQTINQAVIKPIAKIKQDLHHPMQFTSRVHKNTTTKIEINLAPIFNERFKEFSKIIAGLPEQIKTMKESAEDLLKNNAEQSTVEIPVRQIAGYFLESTFLGPVQDKLENTSQELHHKLLTSIDSLRLARFNYENLDQQEESEQLAAALESLEHQVEQDEKQAEALKERLVAEIKRAFKDSFIPFSSTTMAIETAKEFSQFLIKYQSKKTFTRVATYKGKLQHTFKDQVARLIYSKSEGILLARKFTELQHASPTSRILDLVEAVSPRREVLEQLPNYYKNLFSGRSSIGQDFWIYRKSQEIKLQKAVNRFFSGSGGGIALLGERNSGKTAFCRYVAGKYFPIQNIYQIYPPRQGSVNVADLEGEFRKNGIISGSVDDYSGYRSNSAIILHDLELWWERSPHGGAVISILKDLIYHLQDRRVLFIVNMNPYAFALIDRLYRLSESITESIVIEPFDAEELKNLIMIRHFSSRMHFSWKGRIDREIPEWRLARLFNSFFNYSSGNPGDALNAWISSIDRISNQKLYITPPQMPDLSPLDELDPNWRVILTHLILHKRLSKDKLTRIFNMDENEISMRMTTLRRSGLIQERNPDLFIVNPYIEPFITANFKQKELI